MKVALLIVLSLSALAYAGPAFNKNNQIDADNKVGSNSNSPYSKQESQYMTGGQQSGKSSQAVEILKQWCFSSQMSQPELTSSFKKLVQTIKSQPDEQTTEATVMSERICQGAIVQKSAQSGETVAQSGADAQAHELIKDVYMDALIACETRQCKQQLIKIIDSQKVDSIRASYYMTRIAVTEKDSIKDESEIKQLAQSLINESSSSSSSEAIERQKLFATTSLLGKAIENKQQPSSELKQTAAQVAKTILDRYVKSVNQGEAEQYKQQAPEQQSAQVARKIAKRNAALKALTNIPGSILKEIPDVEQTLIELAQNKQEMSTTRQSAIECLEQNDNASQMLKQITFDQQEPIEVRVAALRALMTSVYSGDKKDEQNKQQMANQIIEQVVKHCEDSSNQQSDDQFVLYAISYLDNLRTSQQPEHQAIKDVISKNKQHYMQIQLLCKKFKQQLSDVRKSSRNYKFEQEFNQLESGLIVEGDLIYESKHNQHQQQQQYASVGALPKLIRVNMSMPVMGQTVNVVEITVRQNQMDEELLSALKLVQGTKFNSESMSKVVDSFKSGVQQSNQSGKQQTAEADLTIKSEGMVFVYMSADDFKTSSSRQHQRNTRSTNSIVDEIIEHLKRKPVSFNRGFNFNLNERFAKVLDVEANVIAGLRFESRANGKSSEDFEIAAQVEPRFAFEAIVGPAKMSSKKLMQRVSTKTALGLRLRYKRDELVDVQVDLPMNNMELFTVETQMVEKSSAGSPFGNSYTYLPESIYGQEDIYAYDSDLDAAYSSDRMGRILKRSIFDSSKSSKSALGKMMKGGKRTFVQSYETSEKVARATGLRGKLRMVVSPKDMSLLVQAACQKYEPTMQGYRFQVQKVERNTGESKQYTVSISTPGSRIERTMQVRLQQQSNSQRVSVKADIQAPKMSATCQVEVVHDGRQYSVKVETAGGSGSSSSRQWRHTLEAGFQRSGAQSGRIATTYKPYLAIDSTSLRHPIQMQGALSYQQGPKSVISYEFKCPTSGDFVQGKFILENRSSSSMGSSIYANNAKRTYTQSSRRSMRSPIESLLDNDYTVSGDFAAQVREHELKFHKMLDWDASKKSVSLDAAYKHKNLRKNQAKQVSVSVKANPEQQLFSMERDSDKDQKDYRAQITSVFKPSSGQHQLVAEVRYNGRRQSLAAYKHKIELSQLGHNKIDIAYVAGVTISELKIQHEIKGRTQMSLDRRQKLFKTELSGNGNKSAKLDVEYISLGEHQIYLDAQYDSLAHRTTVRADRAKLAVQSRTEWRQQQLVKLALDLDKQRNQCDFVVECEPKNLRFASELKFNPGQTSSVAIQTGRYSSKAEFSFDKLAHSSSSSKRGFWSGKSFGQNKYHFKSDLKDSMNQQNYWIDSAYNTEPNAKSYLRFSSPIYRSDFEFDSSSPDFAKIGMFARSKRSISYQPYSIKDSILNEITSGKPLRLDADKIWMLRSVVNTSPQKLRKVLFDYADQWQQHQHSAKYDPMTERFNLNLNRLPSDAIRSSSSSNKYSPIRLSSDFGTSYSSWARPSTFSVQSDLIDMNFDAKPFDGSNSYAKLSALSRNRRSPFKKHESEYRYDPKHGYKAWMKHEDSKNKHHSFNLEADAKPKNWAKMAYESDKHGKASYEHNWRKHQSKRSSSRYGDDDEDVYTNMVAFERDAPRWTHRSQLDWQEPVKMYSRSRRDVSQALEQAVTDAKRRYTALDYLKHVSARVNSQTLRSGASAGQYEPIYKLDFDYKPTASPYNARLNLNLADQMLHESSLQFEPSERAYKLQSKYSNLITKQPSYELLASTLGARGAFKSSLSSPVVEGLATSEQEPVFINEDHPMYERAIRSNSMAAQLFKQPLKLDYSDKYGRQARFDYDLAPYMSASASSGPSYAGLRQKRAALYYKDDAADFEHSSSLDFYPEKMLAGGFKKQQYQQLGKYASGASSTLGADFTVKAHTKYGPVWVRADSDDNSAQLELESPVFQAKLTTEGGKRDGVQLIKFKLDNKQQKVDLLKIVRKNAILRNFDIAQKVAHKIDSTRFEHQCELLVSLADAIIKAKSETMVNGRQASIIVGEFNKPQQRAYAKIDGERTKGHLLVDLINKSAELDFDVDNERTVHHKTRLTRTSNKYYDLESYTTYKQQPLIKLSGKIAPMVFDEPQHLFSKRRSSYGRPEDHISTFEATIYDPKPIQVTGVYDCLHKEARFMFNNHAENKVQETIVKFDEQTETVLVDARLNSQKGQIYSYQAKVNVPGLLQSDKCYRYPQSCQSEVSYSDKSGYNYSTKYVPGEYVLIKTPSGKQTINLAY